MTAELANALYPYFGSLYSLNRNLITLCGVDILINRGQYETYLANVIQSIPRLIPYSKQKGKTAYSINPHDGLLEFSAELPWLKAEFDSLLKDNYDCLVRIKDIRNKLEHKIHSATVNEAMSDSFILFNITYVVDGEEKTINSLELITLVKSLNCIYKRIQEELDYYAFKQEKTDHPYYCRLLRFDFSSFNKILSSDLLPDIGRMLYPY